MDFKESNSCREGKSRSTLLIIIMTHIPSNDGATEAQFSSYEFADPGAKTARRIWRSASSSLRFHFRSSMRRKTAEFKVETEEYDLRRYLCQTAKGQVSSIVYECAMNIKGIMIMFLSSESIRSPQHSIVVS
jgi:hypothetical protein